jgi:hypothetical protein
MNESDVVSGGKESRNSVWREGRSMNNNYDACKQAGVLTRHQCFVNCGLSRFMLCSVSVKVDPLPISLSTLIIP